MNKKEDVKNSMDDFDIDKELAELDEYIDDSVKFKIKNGILYDYCGNDSEVVIPNGVKVIGSRAFSATLGLEKVIIPEGVEVISARAFDSCAFLKEVVFPQTLKRIEKEAFCDTSLSNIFIPHSVVEIGPRCFAACNIKELNHPLLKIESGLAIKDNRLLYCADSSLKNVIIPEGIEVINDWAFDMCDAESVTIPSSVKSIGFFAFGCCSNLKSVKLTEGLKVIEDGAFSCCKKLGSVVIPKSVESIGLDAFYRTNMFGNILKNQKCKNDSCGYGTYVRIYNSDGSLDIYNYEKPDDDIDIIYERGCIAHFKNEEDMKAAGWEFLDKE